MAEFRLVRPLRLALSGSLTANAPVGFSPTIATLAMASSATAGVALAGTITLNATADQNYTASLSISDSGTLSTAAPVVLSGATSIGFTATWGAAGTGRTVTLNSMTPTLTVAGSPRTVTVSAAAPPVTGTPGTVSRLGTQSLVQYLTAYRATLPEGESAASARMMPASGINAYCGAIIWRDKYIGGIIAGGHGDSFDDGAYGIDVVTGQWETILPPTTLGNSSRLVNQWGEWGTPPTGQDGAVGRPASCHSFMTQVTAGDDIVCVVIAAVGNLAGGSGYAHRWKGSLNGGAGGWERYGADDGEFVLTSYIAVHDAVRGRIIRIEKTFNDAWVEWIVDNDASATWQRTTYPVGKLPERGGAMIYGSIGHHVGLDCLVWHNPSGYLGNIWILDLGNLAGGWTQAAAGTGTPVPGGDTGLEYVPTLGAFAAISLNEPDKLYYLTPTTSNPLDAWNWTTETFTASGFTPAPWVWGSSPGPQTRLKWSDTRQALIAIKNPNAPPEVFTPVTPEYLDWVARSTASGVVVAYDFGAAPANGGDWKWGSLKGAPQVTCWAKNDDQYSAVRVRDTAIYPPGSLASLRWDVPSLSGERADEWRISIDNYADQFDGDSADANKREFWVQWRTRMNASYATFMYTDRSGGDVTPTLYKQVMAGEGIQPTMLTVPPEWPHGYEGPGTSFSTNHIAYARVDFEGEIVMVGQFGRDGTYATNYGFKYPAMYHGKPGFTPLLTRGQDSSYYTHHNSGNEASHVAACQFQQAPTVYTDKSTCFQYPVDEWFTLMLHVILGPRGHGLSVLSGYTGLGAVRIAADQVLLTGGTYIEHFDPSASAGKKIIVRGATTGAVTATVTVKGRLAPMSFTGSVVGATSGTLTASYPAGNGVYEWIFANGATRTVTVSGGSSTAVSWATAIPADVPTTTAVTAGGSTWTFTGSVDGATSGTLTSPVANGSWSLTFNNPNYEARSVTVTGGVNVTWTGALMTWAPTSTAVPQQALLTLTSLTGPIQAEALTVDELESGFTNSTVEYYGAYAGGSMQLLHRRTGVVLRVGNYSNALGYTATARYGTFAFTTFMTAKSLTQTHPEGKVWIGQVIVKGGPTAPATPA